MGGTAGGGKQGSQFPLDFKEYWEGRAGQETKYVNFVKENLQLNIQLYSTKYTQAHNSVQISDQHSQLYIPLMLVCFVDRNDT